MNSTLGLILFAGDKVPTFVPSFIIIALAVAVPLILGQFRSKIAVPIVVGEILLGIAAGIIYPELKDDQLLLILREIGFGFLFFLAGTEIDLKKMLSGSGNKSGSAFTQPIPLGIISWALTVAIGLILTFALWQIGLLTSKHWYFMAITLSPTSLGIVVAVLKDSQYIRKQLGQLVLISATIADFGAVIVLAVLAPILADGFTSDILLIGLVFVAFFVAWLVLGSLYGRSSIRVGLSALQTPTAPVKMRIAFLIFIGFIALTQIVGAKIVLGTFMGGILLRLLAHHDDHDLLHQLEGVGYGFFVPIFFIMVGVLFDVDALITEWRSAALLVPLLLIIAVANKVIPALLFNNLLSNWRDTLSSGFLLTSRISLMVAAAGIGKEVGVFSSAEEAAVILLATIMATCGPLIFNRVMPVLEDEAPPPIVVTNAGRFGLELAAQFQRHEESVILIDPDPEHIERAQGMGFEAVLGNVEHANEAVQAILEKTEKFVTTYPDIETNYAVAEIAKNRYEIPHIVTEVTDLNELPRFEELGVTAVNPTIDRYTLIGLVTRNPTSYDILTRTDDGQEVHEFMVKNHFLAGKAMREIRLPQGMLVLAIRRKGELIVPNADTRLQMGDQVTIAGELGHVNEMFRMFSTDSSVRVK